VLDFDLCDKVSTKPALLKMEVCVLGDRSFDQGLALTEREGDLL